MKDRPILMSGPMVRATLEDRKTKTRRVVKRGNPRGVIHTSETTYILRECPYGQPGDRLWVRETWQRHPAPREHVVCYAATGCSPECVSPGHLWRPSIFMPRAICRLSLEITEVRAERLQEISEADARAEGAIRSKAFSDLNYAPQRRSWVLPDSRSEGLSQVVGARGDFASLWDSLNAKRGYSWDVNPWVWVLSYRRVA